MAEPTARLPYSAGWGNRYATHDYRRRVVPYLYIAPAMAFFFLLMLYPIVMVFRYSMLEGAILKPNNTFVWFDNFAEILSDPVFRQSIGHTLYFSAMSVIFHVIIGMSFAPMLNSERISPITRSVLRVLYIMPWLFTAVM